jgi:hypothetical protein
MCEQNRFSRHLTEGGKLGAHGREYDTETGKQYEARNMDNELAEADDRPVHKQLRNMLFQRMRGTTENCTAALADPSKSAPLLESPIQSDVWLDDIPNETLKEASAGAVRPGKGWKSLNSHMSKGNLLLKLPSKEKEEEEPRRRRSSLTRRTFNEFQAGSNFSVKQCLLAIMAYMVVSIVIFSFVLEPDWTMIDSCYFAVCTFTTLGTYVLESIIILLSC